MAASQLAAESARPTDQASAAEEAPVDTAFFREFFSTPAPTKAGLPDSVPAAQPGPVVGDYELLNVVGEGGMGVVFRARQRSADRIVALKVIRPERLAALGPDKARALIERFRHEAQAAARLEHDHIVTVHDVGEADGRPYYSMRYVEGPSLAYLLRDGPLACRRAAGYMEPIASAIDEAHRHGILHRDLKPQNILVDARTDRSLVADFGLVKLTESDEGLTEAGDVVGTPAYMSPEQARDSSRTTALSDVYALGATLYHLITGRPVFQAATAVETLRQVIDVTPVPPRQLNPAIDRDLDTICLKCLEKDPCRRYPSARLLQEDLHRYLSGQPIRARPVGVVARAVRWSRRNPMPTALGAVAAICLLVALSAVGTSYVHTNLAYRRSEQSFRQALDAVNVFFTRVSEETLLDQPGLQPLRRDLLSRAGDYYQRFLAQRAGDPSLEQELAETHYRVGVIAAEIESAERALPHFDLALATQRRAAAGDRTTTRSVAALAETLNARARALYSLHRLDEALQEFREARQLRTHVVDAEPDAVEAVRKLANTVMNIGIVLHAQGRGAEARGHFEQAQTLRRTLLEQRAGDPKLLRDLAKADYNLGNLLYDSGQQAASRAHFQAAAERFQRLLGIEAAIEDRYHLSLCYNRLADLETAPDRKLDLYQLALDGLEQLAAQNPRVDRFRATAAGILIEVGRIGLSRDSPSAGRMAFDRASQLLSELVELDAAPAYRRDLAIAWQGLAATVLASDPQQALMYLAKSGQCLEELAQEFPDEEEYRGLKQRNEAMIATLANRAKP